MMGKAFRFYSSSITLISNALAAVAILLIVMNIGLSLIFRFYDTHYRDTNPFRKKLIELRYQLYPNLPKSDVDSFIAADQSQHDIVYDAYTTFKDAPMNSRYINVDPIGFRRSFSQAGWPPNKNAFNIFLFGDSTTFGSGVPDGYTIPSHLVRILQAKFPHRSIAVYNFGRGAYFSSQERILFEKLLMNHTVPNMAIFIDGISDGRHVSDDPSWSEEISRIMDPKPLVNLKALMERLYSGTAIRRGIQSARQGLLKFLYLKAARSSVRVETGDIITHLDPDQIAAIIDRYVHNKQIIESVARLYQVTPIFVWQPLPNYKNSFSQTDPFAPLVSNFDGDYPSRYYTGMADYVRSHPMGNDFYWAADMQDGVTTPLYVDPYHYSDAMCQGVAVRLAQFIGNRKWLP